MDPITIIYIGAVCLAFSIVMLLYVGVAITITRVCANFCMNPK